jgi:hypothetical protein
LLSIFFILFSLYSLSLSVSLFCSFLIQQKKIQKIITSKNSIGRDVDGPEMRILTTSTKKRELLKDKL